MGDTPMYFHCPQWRRDNASYPRNIDEQKHHRGLTPDHRVRLTGRDRQRRPPRHAAPSLRTTFIAREYECETCGHVGWSTHIDLAYKAGASRET